MIIVQLPYPPSTNRAPKFDWTPERVAWLREHYPKQGKHWCAAALGVKESVVRFKASHLGLVARGVSAAWVANTAKHGDRIRGRKRPEQAAVMLAAIHAHGLHLRTPEEYAAQGRAASDRIKKNGHPRGFLGGKHSDAMKAAAKARGLARYERMSQDERDNLLMKQMQARSEKGALVKERPNASWKAGWREIGGMRKYYRSRWEANYARYLQWLKSKGEIADWAHEPKTFWFDGIKRGCMSYLPDFCVVENSGLEVYHEVKGWMDDRSKTKIARMGRYHPTVKLIVIDAKGYRAIAKTVSALIPDWE